MRRTHYMTEKRQFHQLTASILMERDVITAKPTDSARVVGNQLAEYNIGSLPVMDDDGWLVGMVTEFDLIRVLRTDRLLEDVKVSEIMTRDLKTVNEDTPVDEIIRLFETDHLIRVPVVEAGRVVGIVARRDVVFGYIRTTDNYWP